MVLQQLAEKEREHGAVLRSLTLNATGRGESPALVLYPAIGVGYRGVSYGLFCRRRC